MKKTIFSALLAVLSVAASAQTWQDALMISENEYGGTARSIAMGNAMTAVGGDLGSIGLNPAGSAVPGYSQMALTTGLSISVANAVSDNPELGYGDRVRTSYTRFKMPGIGFTVNMDTGRKSGLKRMTFGFVSNSTNDFTGRMYGAGINSSNSFSGAVASSADGYPEDALDGSSSTYGWWNLDEYRNTYGLPWRDIVAYRSGIFGNVNGRYLGLTDWDKDGKNSGILDDLYQRYGFQTKGYKHDMLLNFALNYSDEFYVGANLGFTLYRYGQSEYWSEEPNNASTFPAIPFDSNPNARFQSLEMKRIFSAKAVGTYLKLGFLARPAGTGLRLAAALQTPTIMNIDTRMAWYGKASLTGVNLPAASSPEWDDEYAFVSPWRFNAGVAYTFGKTALLSLDYEVVNYARSHFRSQAESGIFYANDYFDNVNADILDVLGTSHMLRVGAECNLAPGLALRAGYGLETSGQHNTLEWEYNPDDGLEHLMVYPLTAQESAALMRYQFSLGAGYSCGPFFADLALRYKTAPNQFFVPYTYYDYKDNGGDFDYTDKYERTDEPYAVPEISTRYSRFDVMLTLGMRF